MARRPQSPASGAPSRAARQASEWAALVAEGEDGEAKPERMARVLRAQILTGALAPGAPIVESQIARALGVGQPTVREALRVLESEGLVVRQPNRGCSVATLSAAEVEQIFRVRLVLEGLAVDLVVEAGNPAAVAELRRVQERMAAAARRRDADAYLREDLAFHLSLARLSGNRHLERTLGQVLLPLFAFSQITEARRPRLDLVANAHEHAEIIEAIETGDRATAASVLRDKLTGFRAFDKQSAF